MKIIIEDAKPDEEDEIIIRCHELDDALLEMIYGIKMKQKKLIGSYNNHLNVIEPREVFYFESVDNRVFMYCEKRVYETKLKLYEIEEEYEHTDFFRASKSVILNLAKIKSLSPAFNGKFEALLQNGEKIIISRAYVGELKKKLGL